MPATNVGLPRLSGFRVDYVTALWPPRSAAGDTHNPLVAPWSQVTFNILIDVYVKRCQWEEAVRVLETLEKQVG